jgi:hypothetical protein
MKKLIITSILAALLTAGTALMAQDYPDEYIGLPGDNLNLYAVMNLFQESPTIEDFERNLNDVNSKINNLDLNGDNMVDYITVNDYIDGNVHNIVLRMSLSLRFRSSATELFRSSLSAMKPCMEEIILLNQFTITIMPGLIILVTPEDQGSQSTWWQTGLL